MKIRILEKLNIDSETNLIDFTKPVLQNTGNTYNYATTTTERHNMRFDLLCYDMTGEQDLIGEMMLINDYTNPFKIKQNNIFIVGNSNELRHTSDIVNSDNADSIKQLLVNNNKAKQIDKTRLIYNSEKAKREKDKNNIPSQIITNGQKAVEVGNGFILLNPIL